MTLFLLSIWCGGRQFIDTGDARGRLSLSIHWRFQGLLLLCFGRRFMDLPWHSVFENSIRRPWLYFCYRFDVAVVNSLTLAMPDVGCHSIFIDDFKVYSDSVFADDLWISSDITFLTIPCVSLDSIFAIDLMCLSWIHWRCRLHTTVVTQYSWTISRFTLTMFLLPIYGSAVTVCFWQFHASTITLFCYRIDVSVVNSLTLWIPCGRCHSVFIDDFKVYCYSVFGRWFMEQPCDSVFYNFMRRPWLYFFYRFHASIVNSLTLSIPWGICHSIFIDDFKVCG